MKILLPLSLFLVLFTSCLKEEIQQPIHEYANYDAYFIIDGEYSDSEPDLTSYYNLISTKEVDGRGLVTFRSFTNEADYIAYGDNQGLKSSLEKEYKEHMLAYAEEHDLISIQETTGNIPEQHAKYEREYHDQLFGTSEIERSLPFAVLYDGCNNNAAAAPMTISAPFMSWGWNNRVDAYFSISFVYSLSIYDRSWYRTHLATFFDTGWSPECFDGPLAFLASRMSSGTLYGI